MKVAIVDDFVDFVSSMEKAAREAGHQTLGVVLCPAGRYLSSKDSMTELLFTNNLEEVAKAIGQFGADIVFLDNNFDLGSGRMGAALAVMLKMSKESLVGTSDSPQPYCAQKFLGKEYLTGEQVRKKFLNFLG